jgi:type II secretory pathway predicted ATPase ExeA
MDGVAPFTGLLLGQPTLRRRIKLGAFAAFDQRIALRYAMPGMTEPETRDYLTSNSPAGPTSCSPTTPPR